jgi:hypothetical protein
VKGGGEDICIARTEDGLRKGGRSFRGVYRESITFAGAAGLMETDISDGSDETKLLAVTPETRREVAADMADGRAVNELLYGAGPPEKSCSCSSSRSMLSSASSSPGSDCSET